MMDLDRVNNYLARVEESEKTTFKPVGSRLKVGVDLGTAYIVLVVLDEENNPVACEKQAAQVLRDGVVVDYTGALRIVRSLKEKLEARLGTELVNCAIAMPAGTESSVKTHQYVAEGAGLEVTNILDEPSAANAIYQIEDGVVVDIGGGTTDIAVISLSGIVESTSIKIAGDQFDEAIVKYIRRKHNVLIGERTAEELKMQIGCVFPRPEEQTVEIKGRCLMTGLPRVFSVSSSEMIEAFEEVSTRILEAIHGVLERTPPELVADISTNGICMTGGGSLVWGFDKLIESHTGIETHVADDAISCVAYGTGKSLDDVDSMQDGTINLSRRKQMN